MNTAYAEKQKKESPGHYHAVPQERHYLAAAVVLVVEFCKFVVREFHDLLVSLGLSFEPPVHQDA